MYLEPERKERLLGRARELMTEAGFRIGMSDGGLVTEAKPMIKWDKVCVICHVYHVSGWCCYLSSVMCHVCYHVSGWRRHLHSEECIRGELEPGHSDHLRRWWPHWWGCYEGPQGEAKLSCPSPFPKSQVLSSLVQVLKDPTQSRNFHDLHWLSINYYDLLWNPGLISGPL